MPAYCRFSLWVLIVLPLAAWGTPSLAEDLPQAELVLTQGESGLPRDNVFYTGEKVFATLRVTGLGDSRPYMGQIQVTGTVLDADGTEVLRVEKEPEYYSQVLGGDAIETTLIMDSDGKNIPSGNYSLVATVQHLATGRKFRAQRDFVWKEPETLSIGEFCWFLDSNKRYPTGPVIQPARVYTLRTRITNYSIRRRKIELRFQSGVTYKDGDDPDDKMATETLHLSIPTDKPLPERIWYSLSLAFRNPSNALVAQRVTDLPSGVKAAKSFPVVISGRELQEKGGDPNIQLFMDYSYGLHGQIRTADFLPNEDIWIKMGATSVPLMEPTTLRMEAYFLDGTGVVVCKELLGESNFRRTSTKGFYFGEWQIPFSPDDIRLDTIQKLQILVTDKKTGKVSQVSAPIHFSNIKGVAAYNFQVSRDAHNQTPGGQFLTAGQPYYLNCDITKFTVKDYAIDITHSVKAFTEDGQPVAGTELVLDHKRALSVAEKLNAQLPLTMQISLNRPGKFLLRSTFTDNLSGQTYTSDMPVEVVSPFQFVKEAAVLEN